MAKFRYLCLLCFAIFSSQPNNIISTSVIASMAIAHQVITALVFALVLARVELSTCHVLKGSVTCLDCNHLYNLSDIKVLVKCSRVKKLATATTEEDGTFAIKLPSDTPTAPSSLNCLAKILGGPRQLYTSRTKMVSIVVNVPNSNAYTVSTPLKFYTSCPKDAKCRAQNAEIGSSKTIDLPLPREWGLAPTSYYVPFIPIIGIP
ncbi:pollen Ole e 1 allergen and extensin family protein [Actinidia rufa]|uniref:Pollen Ole e 1 allergen and extensin family protein n=1 Tax=Actinidia rufa TaxID=165716 RepID=A0A7J0GQM5_9ERIC|nr:pollen Ole e 1 allergen and extensin family protein [Actinidia rufa]